jgi:hypothetical protein
LRIACRSVSLSSRPQHVRGQGGGIVEREEQAAAVRAHLFGVPERRADDGLSRAQRVRQRAAGDLRGVGVRDHVRVGHTEVLEQFRRADVVVVEPNVVIEAEVGDDLAQAVDVAVALVAQDVRVRGAEDDVEHVRVLFDDRRHGGQGRLDALARAEQAEGQQHATADGVELLAVVVRVDERHVGHAVRDVGDLLGRDAPPFGQNALGLVAHHHDAVADLDEFAQRRPLRGRRLGEHRVQRRDRRHAELPGERQHVRAVAAAEDAVLVLDDRGVDLAVVEDLGGGVVVGVAVLVDLVRHLGRGRRSSPRRRPWRLRRPPRRCGR